MKVSDAFPSKWLRAADLNGSDVTVTIDSIEWESYSPDEDPSPILYFVGKKKGLGLNKTNASTIEGLYGDEMDNWAGRAITLFPTQTDFQGKQVPCIRIRLQAPPSEVAEKKPAAAPVADVAEDDIPF